MASLGEAYLAIVPKLDDSAMQSAMSGITSAAVAKGTVIGNAITGMLKTVASGALEVTQTVVNGAVEQYAAYEQNVGGMQKLYGDAWQTMVSQAQEAYKTCGLSANEYMEQASSFSAALTNSLGGDVVKAAEQAEKAMEAMADNVNTFGTDMTDVQNAFQGFAKQNYTMLDNLKLGYGGTKTEMERLISDANEYAATIGETSDLSIDSFSDIVTAIDLIQQKQNIAGTTAKEAATTVSGSIGQVKAAWTNWLTALGEGNYDTIIASTDNMIESLKTALGNVLPVVQTVFESISAAMPELMATIEPILTEIINTWGPPLAEAASAALTTVMDTLGQNMPDLLTILGTLLNTLIDGLILNPLMNLANTLWANLQTWWAGVIAGIQQWVTDMAAKATEGGSQFLTNIGTFFSQLPGNVANWLASVISSIASFVSSCASQALSAGSQFLSGISGGFNSAVSFVAGIPGRILSAIGNVGSLLYNAGTSIINGLLNGIKNAISGVYNFVSGIAGKIASLKGPLPYDRKVLIPNGMALMQSLGTGLSEGFGDVETLVGGMAGKLASDFGGTVDLAANASLATAAVGAGSYGSAYGGTAYNVYIDSDALATDAKIAAAVDGLVAAVQRRANMR